MRIKKQYELEEARNQNGSVKATHKFLAFAGRNRREQQIHGGLYRWISHKDNRKQFFKLTTKSEYEHQLLKEFPVDGFTHNVFLVAWEEYLRFAEKCGIKEDVDK